MKRKLRTRNLRRKKVRSPTGKGITHLSPRLPSPPRCSNCGRVLHGISRRRSQPQPRTWRAVNRVFGGVLCGRCASESIRSHVAEIWKSSSE